MGLIVYYFLDNKEVFYTPGNVQEWRRIMEELLEVTKKQLKFQKIISGCLAIMIVLMLAAGVMAVSYVNRMTVSMENALSKIEEIDVEGINDTISSTQDMMQSVEEFSGAVDDVTAKVQEFNNWMSGLLIGR